MMLVYRLPISTTVLMENDIKFTENAVRRKYRTGMVQGFMRVEMDPLQEYELDGFVLTALKVI